jgi:hypothetical protein
MLLPINTAVLAGADLVVQVPARGREGVRIQGSGTPYTRRRVPEEHDFGHQERPHAERRGLLLLLDRLELMLLMGRERVRVSGIDQGISPSLRSRKLPV